MPRMRDHGQSQLASWELQQAQAAAHAAAEIGGRAGDEDLDPSQRPLVEAGEGVAEGFELAEADLIKAAEHGNGAADPLADAFTPEADDRVPAGTYGEADHEESSEVPDADR